MTRANELHQTTGADQAKWEEALYGLGNKTLNEFFPTRFGEIEYEPTCDPYPHQCYDSNNLLFKGHTSSWLGWTALLAPQLYSQIMPRLQTTAKAAAAACTGPGQGGNQCGSAWYESKFDDRTGMEEQISAADLFSVNMIPFIHGKPQKVLGPLTETTGGSSTSNPNAGMNDVSNAGQFAPINAGDRAGAGILTALFVAGWAGGLSWMFME
jgi:mannan endo-1,6-alpha-mannosidase